MKRSTLKRSRCPTPSSPRSTSSATLSMATGTTRSHLGEELIDLFIYGRLISRAQQPPVGARDFVAIGSRIWPEEPRLAPALALASTCVEPNSGGPRSRSPSANRPAIPVLGIVDGIYTL